TTAFTTGYNGQAFSFNAAQTSVATLPVDINGDTHPNLTFGMRVKLRSAPTSSNGWVLGHDNGGFDRSLILHDSRYGFGVAAGVAIGASGTDTTAPTLTGSRAPLANANGWNNTNVVVSWTCADSYSGIKTCPPATTVSSEGANQSVSGSAIDNVGNTASATVGNISIDKTAPTLSGAVSYPQ